jgi:hypothetical protein
MALRKTPFAGWRGGLGVNLKIWWTGPGAPRQEEKQETADKISKHAPQLSGVADFG